MEAEGEFGSRTPARMVPERGLPLEHGDGAVGAQEISERDSGDAAADDRNIDNFQFGQGPLPDFRPGNGGFCQFRTTFFEFSGLFCCLLQAALA